MTPGGGATSSPASSHRIAQMWRDQRQFARVIAPHRPDVARHGPLALCQRTASPRRAGRASGSDATVRGAFGEPNMISSQLGTDARLRRDGLAGAASSASRDVAPVTSTSVTSTSPTRVAAGSDQPAVGARWAPDPSTGWLLLVGQRVGLVLAILDGRRSVGLAGLVGPGQLVAELVRRLDLTRLDRVVHHDGRLPARASRRRPTREPRLRRSAPRTRWPTPRPGRPPAPPRVPSRTAATSSSAGRSLASVDSQRLRPVDVAGPSSRSAAAASCPAGSCTTGSERTGRSSWTSARCSASATVSGGASGGSWTARTIASSSLRSRVGSKSSSLGVS